MSKSPTLAVLAEGEEYPSSDFVMVDSELFGVTKTDVGRLMWHNDFINSNTHSPRIELN